ncbi:O-methyltransferase [Erysipelotrichaceae bacterium 66-17]
MNNEQTLLKKYAKENHVPVMFDDGLEFLINEIKTNDVRSFLEIGTAIAKTSLAIASLDPHIKIVTIERDPEMIRQARMNIAASHKEKQITLIEGDANEVEIEQQLFDCIFIDAAKAQYQRFFAKYSPLLSQNGIIVSDNMNFHGMVDNPELTHNRNTKHLVRKIRAYREYLSTLEDWDTTFYDVGDGVAVTRRKKS